MNKYDTKQQDGSFDIRSFIEQCRHRWWWFLIALVIFSAYGAYKVLSSVPTVDVVANVMIYEDSGFDGGAASMMKSFSLGSVLGGSGDVNNEKHVLQSYSVMLATAKELGLNTDYVVNKGLKKIHCSSTTTPIEMTCNPALGDSIPVGLKFRVKYDGKSTADIKLTYRQNKVKYKEEYKHVTLPYVAETPFGAFTFRLTGKTAPGGKPDDSINETINYTSYSAAAQGYMSRVLVNIPDRKSDLISMSVVTNEPKFGELLLNTIVKNYNLKGITEKQDRDRATAEFINNRLLSLTDELSLSEEDIENFQKNKNLIDLGSEAGQILSKLATLEQTMEVAKTELDLMKQTRTFLKTQGNEYSLIPMGLAASVMENFASAYNDKIMYHMSLTRTAKNDNVALTSLEDQIRVMRENMLLSLDKSIETKEYEYGEMRKLNREYEAKLNSFPSEQRLFRAIQRQQTVKEQLYLFLLQQREETALSIANAQPRASVVDNAYTLVAVHTVSKKALIVMILLFSIGFPCGLIFLRDKLRNRIESRKDVERLSELPIIGEISQTDTPDVLVMNRKSNSTVAEQFRLLRSNVEFVLPSKSDKVIMVTSACPGEGKTFIAVNLALALGVLGKKVVLVGADVRRPRLQDYLQENSRYGLTEYLSSDDITISDILTREAIAGTKLDVITAGPVPPNPAELLLSAKFDALIKTLREQYDYVVLDTAPMARVSDSLSIAHVADATIFVVRINNSKLEDLKFANELAEDERLHRLSVLINCAPMRRELSYGYTAD